MTRYGCFPVSRPSNASMRINRTERADLGTFLAIARHRIFRRAGSELGVSASALSHAVKAMEARLGVRLVNRTSRSVTLTAAGEDLLASLDAPFAAIGSAPRRRADRQPALRPDRRDPGPHRAALPRP